MNCLKTTENKKYDIIDSFRLLCIMFINKKIQKVLSTWGRNILKSNRLLLKQFKLFKLNLYHLII